MRHIAAVAVMLVAAQLASARGEPPANAQPPGTTPGAGAPGLATTEQLKKKVEEVGFKDVEIVPHMFVVLAKKPDGSKVSMIVDAQTMQALQLGSDDGPDQGGDDSAGPDGACKGPADQRL